MKVEDFDKIYILHLSDRKDRYDNMIKEFTRMNLQDNIDIWWTCKRPISCVCGDYIKTLHTKDYDRIREINKNLYGGVFNCAFEHYTIIKTSLERGLNNILIFEDDIKFYKDREYFDKCIEGITNDMPICKLYYSGESLQEYNNSNDPIFSPIKDVGIHSTAAYALNREGMEIMTNIYDKFFPVSDLAFLYCDLTS